MIIFGTKITTLENNFELDSLFSIKIHKNYVHPRLKQKIYLDIISLCVAPTKQYIFKQLKLQGFF